MARRAVAITPAVWLPGGGAAGCVAALALLPLAALFVTAPAGGSLGPADYAALRFTIWQALWSAALSLAVAVPFARALMRRRFIGRRVLVGLLGAPFLLPVLVAILGLSAVWGRSGVLSDLSLALGGPRISIYGPWGVVMAHVFFNIPLATRLLLQGWQGIPAERFRLAAQLGLPDRAVFRLLEWPMLRAVCPPAFVLVFLLCLTSFAVALTLGGGPRATTLEVAIYQALRFDFDLGHAARLALVQCALCAAVALAALLLGKSAGFGGGLDRAPQRWDGVGWRAAVDRAVIGLVALFLGAPLVMVVLRGLAGLQVLAQPGLWAALGTSLVVALTAAVLTLAMALPVAALSAALPRGRAAAVEGATLLLLAVSPFVMGTGLFILLRPVLDPLGWALPLTALVNAAVCLPFALRALVPALTAAEADFGRLADSLGLRGIARLRWLVLPRLRAPLGFAAGLSAALSMGDLGVITLFAAPETGTLPLYIYRLMGAYAQTQAAGAALLLMVCSLALFWVFDRGGRLADPV
ncbi:MAG: thiamine/thiamine pyrophosphate ABC transporter permease ThiP [Pseudomonadota bacterium]